MDLLLSLILELKPSNSVREDQSIQRWIPPSVIYVLIQDSSSRSSIIPQVYANFTNPILTKLRNPTIQLFDDALWCLYTFSTCFPPSFPRSTQTWHVNRQRFTCSWSWMIRRKAHQPWAPSLAGFPQWLGVSNPDVLRASFWGFLADEMLVFGKGGVFGCPEVFGDTFCRRANFWRFFISGVIVSGFSTVLVFCGTTAEGQPEKLHLKVVGLGFVWGTQLNQQIMTCRVEIDFNISQYTYVNPMWNGASISFGLVLVALFLGEDSCMTRTIIDFFMNFDDSFAVLPDCYSPCFQPRVPGLCYGRFMRENHTLSSHATWGWHWLCSLETTQRSQTQQWNKSDKCYILIWSSLF